jgi:hydroxymethylglutaryl-CoA reductase
MPKKKLSMTPEEQSERFREAVRAAISAGELNLDEADAAFEKLASSLRTKRELSQQKTNTDRT